MADESGYDMFADPTGELPPALVKALGDPFVYALGLRDGRVLRFAEARLSPDRKWLEIIGFGGIEREGGDGGSIEMSGVQYHFPRGLYVRVSDIMWAADAPEGS